MAMAYQAMATCTHWFSGSFQGITYLLISDAHFKWSEITKMSSTTASKTVDQLRELLVISSYGLPEKIVMDNSPQFMSENLQHIPR